MVNVIIVIAHYKYFKLAQCFTVEMKVLKVEQAVDGFKLHCHKAPSQF